MDGGALGVWKFIALYASPREHYCDLFFSTVLLLGRGISRSCLLVKDFNLWMHLKLQDMVHI